MQNKKPTFSQQSFANAINDALATAMSIDPLMIAYGLGISDPKAIFGTTENLTKKFGAKRVFDMPTSENAMTGLQSARQSQEFVRLQHIKDWISFY